MTSVLGTRLDKLEAKLPQPQKQGHKIRIVTTDEEEAEARKLLKAEGYDPASGKVAIIRLVSVSPGPDHPAYLRAAGR